LGRRCFSTSVRSTSSSSEDALNFSGWEATIARRNTLSEEIEECMRNMRERRKMTAAARNALGFDLSILFIGGSQSWGPNGPPKIGELISQRSRLDPIWIKTKGIEEQFREILTMTIQVRKKRELKSRVMTRLTPESIL
jgi:hypothetical protein